jgi:hypothetical protein
MDIIDFECLEEFYEKKKQLRKDIMKAITDMVVLNDFAHPSRVHLSYHGTCDSSHFIHENILSAVMRYTGQQLSNSLKLTEHVIVAADTCLLAYFLVSLNKIEDTIDDFTFEKDDESVTTRLTPMEILLMLVRQLLLKILYLNSPRYPAFSLSHQFTSVRMSSPRESLPTFGSERGHVLTLQGPFGSTQSYKFHHVPAACEDIIVDVPTAHIQKMFTALAMGTHERLGMHSPLRDCDADVLGLVAQFTLDTR